MQNRNVGSGRSYRKGGGGERKVCKHPPNEGDGTIMHGVRTSEPHRDYRDSLLYNGKHEFVSETKNILQRLLLNV